MRRKSEEWELEASNKLKVPQSIHEQAPSSLFISRYQAINTFYHLMNLAELSTGWPNLAERLKDHF